MVKKSLFSYLLVVGSGAAQALAGLLITKMCIAALGEKEMQAWFLILASLPFYALIDLGVSYILPSKLASMKRDTVGEAREVRDTLRMAVRLHLAALPVVLSIFLGFAYFGVIGNVSFPVLVLIPVALSIRALANVFLGAVYAIGLNDVEKKLRILVAVMNVLILAVLYPIGLRIFAPLTAMLIVGSFAIVAAILSINRVLGSSANYFFGAVNWSFDHNQRSNILTSLPALLILNSLPFIVASTLSARDSISLGIAQQIVSAMSIIATAPIVLAFRGVADSYVADRDRAKFLLLRIAKNTALITSASVAVAWLGYDLFMPLLVKDTSRLNESFIVFFILVLSIEWLQATMTRGAMAAGHFNFSKQAMASAVLVLTLTPLLASQYGLMGVVLAVLGAQLPTCHFFNIRKAFNVYGIRIGEYARSNISFIIVSTAIASAYLIRHIA